MKLRHLLGLTASLALGANFASAQSVIGSVGVTSSAPLLGFVSPMPVSQLIDQSGLSATYVSGVTNFAQFVATTTAQYTCGPVCYPELGGVGSQVSPMFIRFDLGTVMSIRSIAIWNQVGSGSLNTFDLLSDAGSIGSYSVPDPISNPQFATVINFNPVATRYITIANPTNFGAIGNPGVILNEVAFNGTVVPEPASLLMVGAGLAGIVVVARRKRVR